MDNNKNDNKVEICTLSEDGKNRVFPYVGTIPAGYPFHAAGFSLNP
ncbi:hypothetical protein [uncultured Proteiniphilum sp.]|nr:hypothetical protein [uncultured Proteiniphilum sp.]